MPVVILKENAGMNFRTDKGVVALNGFCTINSITNEELSALKSLDSFNAMVKDGFAEVSSKASKEDSDSIASEVAESQAKKQEQKTRNIKRA